MSLDELSLDELIVLCKQANDDFLHNRPHNSDYAFELFRRTLIQGDDEALQALRDLFYPQFRRWVLHHPAFLATDETDEYFASEGFARFYFALRGERLAGFDSVRQVMRYAKLCVHTAIAQYARDHANHDSPLPDVDLHDGQAMTPELFARDLWKYICLLLKTDRQRRLAYLVFVLDMKPAEIVSLYPDEWDNERSISVALYRIRQLLRGDSDIQNWLNGDS